MENISLYVCAYNVERTIEEVIIGILNLDHKPNEIIIVNINKFNFVYSKSFFFA